ncbi:MAG TPA: SMP-30/gluconolactonase/LRE family protein [Acidimicrobiales bacterium]|jgi:sugar lactone lactonase YvrE|nr:SMP-30/gluconolactonase/LRE family protein [Acidimicrobiales bacterium]
MVTSYDATVTHTGLSFGEAPRWHEERLWFSDFYRRGIFSFGEDGERLEHTVPTQPSGLGWLADGTLLAVSMTDCAILAISPEGEQTRHAELAEFCGYWANDLVVAADGTAYAGNFGFALDDWLEEHGVEGLLQEPGPPTANLIVVAPDGSIRQVVSDMAFPNGSVLTEDGRTLIVAETFGRRLCAFDVAIDGTLSNRRVFAQLELVFPDGICLDADGQVWVANPAARECLRVKEGGEVTARLSTNLTSFACMLGGEDRRTLFAITAPSSTTSAVSHVRHGQIESCVVDVPGAGLP